MAKKKLTIDDMLVPKEEIPYEVPENWCWVKLGALTTIKSSKRILAKEYQESGIPFFRSKEVVKLSSNQEITDSIYITEERYNEIKDKFGVPKVGDLLITCVGTIGETWIVDDRKFYYKDGNIIQIDSNEYINTRYIELVIKSTYFINWVNSTVSGSAYSALTIDKLKQLPIPLPPLAEQVRIVNRIESLFEKVDKAAGLVDEAREDFESRKTSILQKGFKGEVIGKEYTELVNLGELITDVSSGFACGKQNEISKDEDGAYPHFRPNNVGFYNQFNYDKIVYIPQEKVQKGKGTLSKGDIIFNNTNSTELVGRAVVVREDMDTAFSNHLTRIRVDESRVIPEWVAYCINTLWKQGHFASICKQWVGQSGVNQDVLKNEVAIPAPPIDEQKKIVDILDKLLEKEFKIEDSSNIDRSIDVIKKSILAKAFRGELGSNDLNEESSIELLKNLIK
ncbi:restriction endonuclease subunit S [Romboutsia sp. MSSM.1001216sp_RTP31141st1_G3_RTP31141_220114]|uniref:restriction endonuclease subunit S n=1 Tax=unclassified Romboutsia TaxID=2626894 RepID=UPI0031B650E5